MRKELRSVECKISKQEFLLGPQDGDTMMAPPQADLNVILESETVEIVEGGDAQPEGATQGSPVPPRRGGRTADGDQRSGQPRDHQRG